MKKIILSCSVLVMLACGTALAGGPDMMPPMPSCFEGFSIGIEGAFWHTSFKAYDAGRIFCKGKDCKTDDSSIVLLGPTVNTVGTTFGTAAALFGPTDFSFDTKFSDNGDGTDLTGAIGVQLTYGKVFHGASFNNFYLGVTGFADFDDASNDITAKARDIQGLLDFGTDTAVSGQLLTSSLPNVAPVFLPNTFAAASTVNERLDGVDVLDVSGDVRVNTHVDMENLYGVAAKIGYVFLPNVLAYIKAGAAWSEISVDTTITAKFNFPEALQSSGIRPAPADFELASSSDGRFRSDSRPHHRRVASTSTSDTEIGWLVGAGMEYCLTDHFTINAEYNFVDFDTISSGPGKAHHLAHEKVVNEQIPVNLVPGTTSAQTFDPQQLINATAIQATAAKTDLKISTFKVGLNYYFNFM